MWFPLTIRDPRKVSSLGGGGDSLNFCSWMVYGRVINQLLCTYKPGYSPPRMPASKHQNRLQSPMDDPPICTCCQESHGAHKWRRNKRMPARWCRCTATIAVFLPSITGKIVKWHLPSTIKLEDWRCTLANHYNTRFERSVCLPGSHVVNPIQLIIWGTLAFWEWPWPLYCWLAPTFFTYISIWI